MNFSRRKIIATTASILAMPAIAGPAWGKTKRIIVRDDGGIYTKAYGAVFYRPFTEATGIEVVGVQAAAEPTAQIKLMVDAHTYTWDMAKISPPAVSILTSGNKVYLEKLNIESDPVVASIPAKYRTPYSVGTNVYTSVIAYRKDSFKNRPTPDSWANFWNVKDFPGRRAMYKYPYDTIEEALMASGVPTADVYPCNLKQAFASLDKIRPHINVWWTSGAQVAQMLESGEVDMVATWVSRAQAAQNAGAPVGISWNQNIWAADSWAILAGTPNADACKEFIKFTCDPKRQAELTKYFPAGLTQPKAFDYVKPEIAKNCPTYPANIKNGLQINTQYWVENSATALQDFNAWILT